MKRHLYSRHILLTLFLLIGFSASAQNDTTRLGDILMSARMNGGFEIPAVTTNGVGVAGFHLDPTMQTLFINVAVAGLSGPITAAHIHDGGPSETGGILLGFDSLIKGNRIQGTMNVSSLPSGLLQKMLAGKTYINVHTTANPGGEIRGNITLEQDLLFVGVMSGAKEVPSNTSSAYGLAVATISLDRRMLHIRALVQGVTDSITGAHIHKGGPDTTGPVVINLMSGLSGNMITVDVATNTLRSGFLDSFMRGLTYINVHSNTFPGGHIRSQMTMAPSLAFDVHLDGAQEVPPVSTTARGLGVVWANPTMDTIHYEVVYEGLSGAASMAHFHAGRVKVSGPVIHNISSNISGNRISGIVTGSNIDTLQMRGILSGGLYINVHTSANPGGEIRGQVDPTLADGYNYDICGAQEVPTKTVLGQGSGTLAIARDFSSAHFMVAADSLTGPITAAHFHGAPIGQSGNPILPVTMVNNGAFDYWRASDTGTLRLDGTDIAAIKSGNVYYNVHTSANPGGEIRGQVVKESLCNIFTGLAENASQDISVQTFPIPVRDNLQIQFKLKSSARYTIEMIDVQGRAVLSEKRCLGAGPQFLSLPVSNLHSGIYLLRLAEEGKAIYAEKVIKQ